MTAIRAVPDHVWIYSASKQTTSFHISANRFTRLNGAGRTPVTHSACGAIVACYEPVVQPPEHLELCDDCALIDMFEPSVYRFWDTDDVLLYVGCSDNVLRRFIEHGRPLSKSQEWWLRQVRHSIATYPTIAEAFAAETAAIKAEGPLYPKPKAKPVRQAQVPLNDTARAA